MIARRQTGFTLIELVVTVAIVGLLASMVMPLTQLIAKRAKEHELRADLRDIRDALDHFNELYRYSCLNQGGGNAPGGQAPVASFGGAAPGLPGASSTGGFGNFGGGGSVSSSVGGSVANTNGAGSVAGAGLGGAGGVSASTVTNIGGNASGGGATVLPTPPKMECLAGATGWPKDLQTLVDGVNNIASAQPGAKIYFLRRIPRDPMNTNTSVPPDQSWGLRSSASSATEPQEGEDVFDVYTLSPANDLTGQPYRDW